MVVAVVLLGLVEAVLLLVVLGLVRTHTEILRALDELEAAAQRGGDITRPGGDPAVADVTGVSPSGDAVHTAVVGAAQPTLLAFLSTGCLACRQFWSAFADGADLEGIRLVVVTRGPGRESPDEVAALASTRVVTVMSDDAWSDYGVRAAPYFVLVDGRRRGRIREASATTWDQLLLVLERAERDRSGSSPLRAEDALRAAGIGPGDLSLHHRTADPGVA